MNSNEIKNARIRYKNLVEEGEILVKLKAELEALKQDEKVQRYLELKKYDSKRIKTEEELRCLAFSQLAYFTESSRKILVFQGTYFYNDKDDSEIDFITYVNNLNADYNLYIDLETKEKYEIAMKNFLEFEQNNKVIIPEVSDNSDNCYGAYFERLRKIYFKELITNNQTNSYKKIRKMVENER